MDFEKAFKELIEKGKKQIKRNEEICKILDRDLEKLEEMNKNYDDIIDNLKQVK
ncbi:hypothetical protein OSC52_00280 [Clostridium pasteurianum]|uniref:hypothetical protein n=1 Tax=Clostridium pasteurianum TaxID=1501 RepID=UPI00226083BF|nr:hypothetical protein [Clostridium pasteurianum]UZW14343.1 hypothetical protein OSC52_00280 [Clostridium pasteurianum]